MCIGPSTKDNAPKDRAAHKEILLFSTSLVNTHPESPSFLHYIFSKSSTLTFSFAIIIFHTLFHALYFLCL